MFKDEYEHRLSDFRDLYYCPDLEDQLGAPFQLSGSSFLNLPLKLSLHQLLSLSRFINL